MPIGLHFFMNLWWILFNVGDNALGGFAANVFRVATIAITVIATIIKGVRTGGMKISWHKLLQNRE